jgi:peptidoglycan hydrolase-like protein with peptidoglycan-binding domain
MGTGFLRVASVAPQYGLPTRTKEGSAEVRVFKSNQQDVIASGITNDDGESDYFELDAPDRPATLDSNQSEPAYSLWDVEVSHPGFNTVFVQGVEILDGISSTLPVELLPLLPEDAQNNVRRVTHLYLQPPTARGDNNYDGTAEEYPNITGDTVPVTQPENIVNITPHGLTIDNMVPPEPSAAGARAVRDVYIPTNITVHLGAPSNSSARNVTVPFAEYIANVASSEIYATWPTASLYANMFAITTFAINRIYTEWYRGRGYNFDITNNTAYDQYFVYGRNIYDNLQQIADEIFTMYVRRQGYRNPLFTQYCSGTTVTCSGLSQWGTVDLANRGYNATQILRYYYGNDIEIAESDDIRAIQETFPGTAMTQGQTGEHIRLMQEYLNRIRLNYPAIPAITSPNGYFGADTAAAVRAFQRIFGLTQDGVIGRATWNKISQIYVSIVKLAELNSEGERIGIGNAPPTATLRQGSSGSNVQLLQYILTYISQYYDYVPPVSQDGKFGAGTANAVREFQRNFGLTADGVVGAGTWNKLYEVWNTLHNNTDVPMPTPNQVLPEYPGTVLSVGSAGVQVGYIQKSLNSLHSTYPKIPSVTVDNNYGPATANAVRIFQTEFNIAADGVVGRTTWETLNNVLYATGDVNQNTRPPYPGRAYRMGDSGTDVIYIQKSLQTISKNWTQIPSPGEADGKFGANTNASVIAFQRYFGLTPDGIVGRDTWNMLNTALNQIVP